MRTIGTYVERFCADEAGSCGAPTGARPSDSNFVVNRWPSEILSTSMATASSDCSIRSSLPVTSIGTRGFLASESILRAYALVSGIPIAQMIAVANAPSGTTISGPISTRPHGAGAVCGYDELYLRSASQRARGIDSSVVRPDRLTCDRQPEPGTAGLIRHVWLPDSLQTVRCNALTVVCD